MYKNDGEGDVQPKHECAWMELESLSCLESFGATQPCKQEGLVRGLGGNGECGFEGVRLRT